jgi:hypothetical protein
VGNSSRQIDGISYEVLNGNKAGLRFPFFHCDPERPRETPNTTDIILLHMISEFPNGKCIFAELFPLRVWSRESLAKISTL